jgi:hypothetical protein
MRDLNLLYNHTVKYDPLETYICDLFVEHMEKLRSREGLLINDYTGEFYAIRGDHLSRYTKSGQEKIKRKIRKRLGPYFVKEGVMLTFTYDHDRFSRGHAWSRVGDDIRRVMDLVNRLRKKSGAKKRLIYFKVIEDQPGSGYPAPHVVCPGLRSLMMSNEELAALWGNGFTKISSQRSGFRPSGYACKYITKMSSNYLMMSYLWYYRIRLYSFSRIFKYAPVVVSVGWRYCPSSRFGDLEQTLFELAEMGYCMLSPPPSPSYRTLFERL